MSLIEINGTDISTLGFYPTNLESWWGGVQEQIDSYPLASGYFARRGEAARTPPKSWPLQLVLQDETQANRVTKLDSLRRLLAGTTSDVDDYRQNQTGECKIRVSDSTRVVYAVYQGDRHGGLVGGRHYTSGAAEVTLDLVLYDAAKYESTSSQVTAIGSTPKVVTLGTLPSLWTFSITGAATSPQMRVHADSSGVAGSEITSRRITVTGSLSGAQTLVLNGIRHIATLSSSDVTSTYLPPGSGYFNPLGDRPEDISAGQVWVACTSGTAVLDYRKRWR